MLFFVQSLSGNSLINCWALKSLHSDRLLTEILFSLLNCAMLTGSVGRNFQNLRYFWRQVWKTKRWLKSKPTEKLEHADSILEYFEYFCQMSSKLILIILSYTVSKFALFFWDTVYSSRSSTSEWVSSFLTAHQQTRIGKHGFGGGLVTAGLLMRPFSGYLAKTVVISSISNISGVIIEHKILNIFISQLQVYTRYNSLLKTVSNWGKKKSRARLSLEILSSSITRFSYGANSSDFVSVNQSGSQLT